MQEKVQIFDRLRSAMRIALPNSREGIKDEGEDGIKTIKESMTALRSSEELKQLANKDKAYKKMIEQIDKYWEKLFADPIIVKTPTGPVAIQPQRTNNILESFFRGLRRNHRRKSGTNSLTKTLKAMLADTPLVKNLENPEYMKMILKGKEGLAERFADIDIQIVRQEMKAKQAEANRIPAKFKKMLRQPKLPTRLLNLQKQAV